MKFTIKDGEEFDVVFQDIDLRLSSKDFFTKENSVKKNVTDKRK